MGLQQQPQPNSGFELAIDDETFLNLPADRCSCERGGEEGGETPKISPNIFRIFKDGDCGAGANANLIAVNGRFEGHK